jgi:hypothetical protein
MAEQHHALEREEGTGGLLDPIDRISEILFGLIMAVTIVGSLSIASAGHAEVRTVLVAALGCNLAWGLVDAVMYVVRTLVERTRGRTLARRIAAAEPEAGRALLTRALPPRLGEVLGADELEGMRRRIVARPRETGRTLELSDYGAALLVFFFVVVATFPVVAPFLFIDRITVAMAVSRWITLVMLFFAGSALGRHAGYARPWLTGMSMALFGAVLIVVVMALGG